jgi:hypothetical protein
MCGLFIIVPMAMFIILQAICKDECECEKQSVINVDNHAHTSCATLFLVEEEPKAVEEVKEVKEDMKLIFASNVLFTPFLISNAHYSC